MPEHAVTLQNPARETLVGVWHEPQGEPRAVLIMLHGWSGYRTGPHQMLTRAARRFCDAGYAVLRFDFAGRGDSGGQTELATLATMQEDTRTAMSWCRERASAPLLLVGLCSGCEIAVACANQNAAGVVLWSAPIFAALPSKETASKKRLGNLKQYARKLTRVATWKKLLSGKVDTGAIGKAVAGGGGAAQKNVEADVPGQLPPGFRQGAMDSWHIYNGPIFATYGTADPIAQGAAAWYREKSGTEPQFHWVEGANHSYYGLAWEAEVIEVTKSWLKQEPWSPKA